MFNAGKMQGLTSGFKRFDTFKQLAKQYCVDGQVHYTSKGGFDGGEEAADIIDTIKAGHDGQGPEVLLSVDTMAILPKRTHDEYRCFSAHPGPLDTIKVEGMQGTLRSLANQILYDQEGVPLSKEHVLIPDTSPLLNYYTKAGKMGIGSAYLKGTLFLQHPELDKGPIVDSTLTEVYANQCAYEARDMVYNSLLDKMIEYLPTFLDRDKREELVTKITAEKAKEDEAGVTKVPELSADQLARWQGGAIAMANEVMPWGAEVFQNKLIHPSYFEYRMFGFSPLPMDMFEEMYREIFKPGMDSLEQQSFERLEDPWARLYTGEKGVSITQTIFDPETGKPQHTHEFSNDATTGEPIIREVYIITGEKRVIPPEDL